MPRHGIKNKIKSILLQKCPFKEEAILKNGCRERERIRACAAIVNKLMEMKRKGEGGADIETVYRGHCVAF